MTCYVDASSTTVSKTPDATTRRWGFSHSGTCESEMTLGTAIYAPDDLDTQITATDAAALCGVTTQAISQWVKRGHLPVAGLNEQGRRTYTVRDVARVEQMTRQRIRKMCR